MTFIEGIDTHRYNGEVDYEIARNAGAKFVLSRCGGAYLNTYQPFADIQWLYNVNNVSFWIPCFGVWWYFVGSKETAVTQAQFCADLIKPYLKNLTMGFWLDCEKWLVGKTAKYNRDAVLLFVDEFQDCSGIPVRGIYTRQSIWDWYVAETERWYDFHLWASRFNCNLTSPWSDGRYKFRDWGTWKIWQDSADGNCLGSKFGAPPPPAADADMDHDLWYGTIEQLYEYCGLLAPLSQDEINRRLIMAHPELFPEQYHA